MPQVVFHAAQGQSGAYKFVTRHGTSDVDLAFADKCWPYDAPHSVVALDEHPPFIRWFEDDRQLLRLMQYSGVLSTAFRPEDAVMLDNWDSLKKLILTTIDVASEGYQF